MKDKYGTEVLGVTFTQDGIAVNITRTDTHLIETGDKLIFVCDEMEYKDVLGAIQTKHLEQENPYYFIGFDESYVKLQNSEGEGKLLFREDMEYLLRENCWNIPDV